MANPYSSMSSMGVAALPDNEDIMEGETPEAMSMDMVDEDMPMEVDPLTGEISDPTTLGLMTILPTIDPKQNHNENLAKHLPNDYLKQLGQEVIEAVDEDIESRLPWYKRYAEGLKELGVYQADKVSGALGTQEIKHPLLLEAGTQFQARAMAELFPPSGPAKGRMFGDVSHEKAEKAQRLADHLNYQLTVEDRTYYDEQELKYFRLPFSGSEFDKQYQCPLTKHSISRWVRSENFIMPYGSSGVLENVPRYTEIIPDISHNQFRRYVSAGFYRDVDLSPALTDKPAGLQDVEQTIADLQGETKGAAQVTQSCYTLYEHYADFSLPGFEGDFDLPYVVTVDKESGTVVSIYRNWEEGDESYKKQVWHTHKRFLPGFGAYGFGFIHTIGALGEGASKILNILIDSGAFATLQGGFKSRDAKLAGDVELEPGKWIDTEMTAEELSKAFYTPPFKEPSPVMQAVLGIMVDGGRRFAATTEVQVGDAPNTGPVGTTVALIEAGSKVYSGIHKRAHKSIGDELRNLSLINKRTMPDCCSYMGGGMEKAVYKTDFDELDSVIPVSDPNIYSSAQRIAIAQTQLQLAQSMPDIVDRREAAIQLLKAINAVDPYKLVPQITQAERADPVTEGTFATLGRPLRAYMDQDHNAHAVIHMQQMNMLPAQGKQSMQAHIVEHIAMGTRVQAMQQLGMQLPELNWGAKPNESMQTMLLPPEIEAQITMAAAQIAQKLAQQQAEQAQQQAAQGQGGQQGAPQGQPPADPVVEAQKKAQADAIKFQSDQQRKDAAAIAEIDRKDAMAGISPQLVKQATEFIQQMKIQEISPRELAMLAKVTGKPFIELIAAIGRMMNEGQGGSQFQQTEAFNRRDQM